MTTTGPDNVPSIPGEIVTVDTDAADLVATFDKARRHTAAFYRRSVDDGDAVEMLAIGVAAVFDDPGDAERSRPMTGLFSRFRRAADDLDDDLLRQITLFGWTTFDPDYPQPTWTGFARRRLFVPRVLIRKTDAGATATIVGDDDQPPRQTWQRWQPVVEDPRAAVDDDSSRPSQGAGPGLGDELSEPVETGQFRDVVARVIDADDVDKAVIARRALVTVDDPIDIDDTLRTLNQRYPSCTLFAICPDARAPVFAGATPERLVEAHNRQLSTMALAGTTRDTDSGDTNSSRRDAERALTRSDKDRREHQMVVDMIVDQLDPVCTDVDAAEKPRLRRLANVAHLETPITAGLADDTTVADVVDRLHPTPAVCGVPHRRARSLIRQLEGFDRGLYAGAFGWIDADGDGVFDVALRCGLLHKRRALLYAGAGIVDDSDVDVEWQETAQKFEPMRRAVGGEES